MLGVVVWAVRKAKPYAARALDVYVERWRRSNESPSEKRARRLVERQVWESKSKWHKAETRWVAAGPAGRRLWLKARGWSEDTASTEWIDLPPRVRDDLMED